MSSHVKLVLLEIIITSTADFNFLLLLKFNLLKFCCYNLKDNAVQ